MSQNNQSGQPHIIREMYDATNISQPAPSQIIPSGVTPANIQPSAPHPQWPPAKNGFTTDNLQPPTTEPIQESSNE